MPAPMLDPISKRIKIVVLCVHAVFLGFIFFGSSLLPVKSRHKPLIVKTVIPKAAATKVQPMTHSSNAAQPSARPKPTTPPKPAIEKPASAPKAQTPPATQPQPALKKDPAIADKRLNPNAKALPSPKNKPDNRGKISDQLRKELEASIAKIEGKKQNLSQKQQPSRSQAFTPIQLDIDSADTGPAVDFDSDYPNLMIGYLHQSLHLPEFGEVKIQLTLRQDGSVAKLVVLNTESEKNKRYLEGNLPRLKLPSFNGSFAQKKEHTFVLTFCNEI